DEERHPLARLHGLVLRIHMTDRTTEPHHLSRHGVSQERAVGRLAVRRSLDQSAARAEIDPQQLAQLTAGPRRKKSGHLVLDVGRERNSVYLQDRDGYPRPSAAVYPSPPRVVERAITSDEIIARQWAPPPSRRIHPPPGPPRRVTSSRTSCLACTAPCTWLAPSNGVCGCWDARPNRPS